MSDRLNRAIERLLRDESPAAEAEHLDVEEQQMLRVAQLMRGSHAPAPSAAFTENLRDRLFPSGRRISRRSAFLSGIGTLAAGILAGIGLDRAVKPSTKQPSQGRLVARNGRWFPVAQVADLPDGAVHPFAAGAVQGFVIHRSGRVRALSSVCTHMGCALRYDSGQDDYYPGTPTLQCPCHGAEFDLRGDSLIGPGGYTAHLPPLPAIPVRVTKGNVEVWAIE